MFSGVQFGKVSPVSSTQLSFQVFVICGDLKMPEGVADSEANIDNPIFTFFVPVSSYGKVPQLTSRKLTLSQQ